VFCVVAIGVLMATLDSSIVNISLPTIARSFGRPLNGPLQWVIIAYLLVIVALLLTGGRLGDMFGRKRIWQVGLAVFTVGSALRCSWRSLRRCSRPRSHPRSGGVPSA
jgi:MFS family permease